MTEWGVVGVIVTLVGLVSVFVGAALKLNTSMVQLTMTIDRINDAMEELTAHNTDGHRRLWEKSEEQDQHLNDHEKRITVLEKKGD